MRDLEHPGHRRSQTDSPGHPRPGVPACEPTSSAGGHHLPDHLRGAESVRRLLRQRLDLPGRTEKPAEARPREESLLGAIDQEEVLLTGDGFTRSGAVVRIGRRIEAPRFTAPSGLQDVLTADPCP